MKNYYYLLLIIGITLLKFPFFLTHHIQEDAFITWRCAQNILNYGVYGYNGLTKISASTTHLYVLYSLCFNWLFGQVNFIYPLLVSNCLLFSAGTVLLAKTLLEDWKKQIFFVFLINLIPPAIKASILGMEYCMLFFFYGIFMYYGLKKQNNWVLISLPILILWTRLDTAIFLGISFLYYTIYYKKINWFFVLGGLIGFVTVIGFNWFYFGEIINHTITAKGIAYKDLKYDIFGYLYIAAFNIGLIKYTSIWILIPSILFLGTSVFSFYKTQKQSFGISKLIMNILMAYAWIHFILFILMKANFDWYYWIPQLVFFSFIILYFFQFHFSKIKIGLFLTLISLPLLSFQIIHSIATGNGEYNHREAIGAYLHKIEPDKNQWIMLEPAGYIPYYSGLKAIDEVGLVDARVTEAMKKDDKNWWINTVEAEKPKYLLTIEPVGNRPYTLSDNQKLFFEQHYQMTKIFRIEDALHSKYCMLENIYRLKPSGRDYYLYIKK